jgi:hypothetical protein
MSGERLTWKYPNSDLVVERGDAVLLDDRSGRVELVCMPGSPEAEDYYCEETGGVLILFDDNILRTWTLNI